MLFDIDDGEALVIEVEIPRKVIACTANVSREDDVAHPMQRFGMMDEIAAATVWLFSDESSYVMVQILPVEGGYTASCLTVTALPGTEYESYRGEHQASNKMDRAAWTRRDPG